MFFLKINNLICIFIHYISNRITSSIILYACQINESPIVLTSRFNLVQSTLTSRLLRWLPPRLFGQSITLRPAAMVNEKKIKCINGLSVTLESRCWSPGRNKFVKKSMWYRLLTCIFIAKWLLGKICPVWWANEPAVNRIFRKT